MNGKTTEQPENCTCPPYFFDHSPHCPQSSGYDEWKARQPGRREYEIMLVGSGISERASDAVFDAICRDVTGAERDRLLNSPVLRQFADGIVLEALHQRERWGTEQDAGKEPLDWFWLVGWLAGKVVKALDDDDTDKALHHTISTAAVFANWHAHIMEPGKFRPGLGAEKKVKATTLQEVRADQELVRREMAQEKADNSCAECMSDGITSRCDNCHQLFCDSHITNHGVSTVSGSGRCSATVPGEHIVDGEFQSDKYEWSARGFCPLKLTDPMAWRPLWLYAQERRTVDAQFAGDLQFALAQQGWDPSGDEYFLRDDIWSSCPAAPFPTQHSWSVRPPRHLPDWHPSCVNCGVNSTHVSSGSSQP